MPGRKYKGKHSMDRATVVISSAIVFTFVLFLLAARFVFATATVTPATGGEAISADTVGGAYTALTGPVISEGARADIGIGTIILNAPSGFEFDTAAPTPTVLVTRTAGGGPDSANINNVASGTSLPVTGITTSQTTFTITGTTEATTLNSLTWQNIRVRPTAASPLASGDITKSGTSAIVGVIGTTNFGTLTEVESGGSVPPTEPPSGGGSSPTLAPEEIRISTLPEDCTTSRDIRLLIHAHNADLIKISNIPDLSDAEWMPYEYGVDRLGIIDWELEAVDGEKNVYIMFESRPFGEISDVQTVSLRLDGTYLCHSEAVHSFIIDAQGKSIATDVNPNCLSDYAHAFLEPYVIFADGRVYGIEDDVIAITSSSIMGTEYVFRSSASGTEDGAVIRVERIGNEYFIHTVVAPNATSTEIGFRIKAADRGTIRSVVIWPSAAGTVSEEMLLINLEDEHQLCAADLVPHPHAGDLFQSLTSDVYYFGSDNARHAFPNEAVFTSWYPETPEILVVPAYLLPDFPLGDNVPIRPGTLVRFFNEFQVYVADIGPRVRPLADEVLIKPFFGTYWADSFLSITTALLGNCTVGTPVSTLPDLGILMERPSLSLSEYWLSPSPDEEAATVPPSLVFDGRVAFDGLPYHTGSTELRFRIYGKDGRILTEDALNLSFGSRVYVTLVRDDFSDFHHLVAEETAGVWSARTWFEGEGFYHAYIDIDPIAELNAILRADVIVGDDPERGMAAPGLSPNMVVSANPSFQGTLCTDDIPIVAEKINHMNLLVTKDGQPFTDFQPRFDTLGHIVILNHDNPNVYMHMHAGGESCPIGAGIPFTVRFPYAGRYTVFVQVNALGEEDPLLFPITIDVPKTAD